VRLDDGRVVWVSAGLDLLSELAELRQVVLGLVDGRRRLRGGWRRVEGGDEGHPSCSIR
jgi:hypothetical protein